MTGKDNTSEVAGNRKPYVRYEQVWEIPGKGAGYSIKKAAKVFVNANKFECNISLIEPTSDSCKIIFSFYDNGNYDFNMSALVEHIQNSGQLPNSALSKIKLVSFNSLPCDYLPVESSGKGDISWQKTVEKLQSEKGAQERTISGLNTILNERQSIIDGQTVTIGSLEKALTRVLPVQYDTPAVSILKGYLTKGKDALGDASTDYDGFVGSDDLDVFLQLRGKSKTTFIDYVNAKTQISFENEKEFEQWLDHMTEFNNWEETITGKDYDVKKTKLVSDRQLLETAIATKASEDMITSIRAVLQSEAEKLSVLEPEVEKEKKRFAEERKAYEKIGNLKEDYELFELMRESSFERKKEGRIIPVLASVPDSGKHLIRVYVPSVNPESLLEKHLNSLITSGFPVSEGYSINVSKFDEDSQVLDIVPKLIPEENRSVVSLSTDLSSNLAQILQDPVFEALGVKPKVMGLIEF